MDIKVFSLGPLGTNCYIVYKESKALIFDPGGEAQQVINFLNANELEPLCILLTHAHFDHIGAVDDLRKKYALEVYLHQNEKDWLTDAELNRSLLFTGGGFTTDAPDHYIEPGQMNIGPFHFDVIHTPGHSPGSVTFIFNEYKFIISGDVLFQGGVGRTDLPGGEFSQLVGSLREKIYKLPEDFTVLPGHGGQTNIGVEKRSNPYIPSK